MSPRKNDFQANAEFQQELIDLLGEIDLNVRDEFVRRLEKRRLFEQTFAYPRSEEDRLPRLLPLREAFI